LPITCSRHLEYTYVDYNAIELLGIIAFRYNIYANRSLSAAGFIDVLTGGFAGVIKYIKERSANIVIILKA
jgi:hypothetical protein